MKIEKNKKKPARPLYKFTETMRSLEVGDSLTIPYGLRAASHTVAKRIDINIETAKEGKNIRIWRV